MPHFKCSNCSARLYSAARPTRLISDLCPECRSPVMEVRERAQAPIVRTTVAARIGHVIARREVIRAQLRFDAERWADDGGSFPAEALLTPRSTTGI